MHNSGTADRYWRVFFDFVSSFLFHSKHVHGVNDLAQECNEKLEKARLVNCVLTGLRGK